MTTTTGRPATPDRHPALEDVAAFVDGRLVGEERRRMVAHLADCDTCQELVTETVLLLREAPAEAAADDGELSGEEGDDAPATTGRLLTPPPSRFRRTLPLIVALAAAAVVALLVWTPTGERILGREEPVAVTDLTVPLPTGDPRLAEILREQVDANHGWTVFLGEAPGPTQEEERDFKLGVQVAELHWALATGDRPLSRSLAAALDRDLTDGPAELVARYYTGPGSIDEGLATGAPSADLLDLGREADALLAPDPRSDYPGYVDELYYALGKWAGAGRLAVAAEQLGWFGEPGPRRALRHLRRADLPPDLAEPFSTIVETLDADPTPADLPRLAEAFETLIRRAGGGRDPEEAS